MKTIKELVGSQLTEGVDSYTIKNNKLEPFEIKKDSEEAALVCLFSCGSTSYVATKMALEENKKSWGLNAYVIYTMVVNEPADNLRFLQDAQEKLGIKVIILINSKFKGDIYNVQNKKRYISGIAGAPCTTELKWRMRKNFVSDNDIQVFGFESGEEDRMDNFAKNNPTVEISCPLICNRITKKMAFDIIVNDGIKLPESYDNFMNANCVGCVKGQSGYWNVVRKVAPEVFKKQGLIERRYNASINKKYKKFSADTKKYINEWLVNDGKELLGDESIGKNIRLRVFLDQLDKNAGRYKSIKLPDCGVLCELEQGLK